MLTTPRLTLRTWTEADIELFARMNADPRVMRYFPALLTREETAALVTKVQQHFEKHGFGPFALELRENSRFIGFTGLSIPNFSAHFTPCVEIGWRLDAEYWNNGLATEAAQAALDHAFRELRLPEVVSFTTLTNAPSRRVMEKIGMTFDPNDNFDHPNVPEHHPLRPHVLYRIRNRSSER